MMDHLNLHNENEIRLWIVCTLLWEIPLHDHSPQQSLLYLPIRFMSRTFLYFEL